MADRYIIAADRAHLRIYRYSQEPGQFTPSLQPVDAYDLPEFEGSYFENVSTEEMDFSPIDGRRRSNALEEHLAIPDVQEQRIAAQLAERISSFMLNNPNSTWDLGANSSLRNELIEELPDGVRRRLNQIVSKDLVNVSPAELREHFSLH